MHLLETLPYHWYDNFLDTIVLLHDHEVHLQKNKLQFNNLLKKYYSENSLEVNKISNIWHLSNISDKKKN